MDRILKLVYSNWYYYNGDSHPIPNGVHPVLVKHIQESALEIHEWYYSIKEILLHNQALLYNMKDLNPYEESYQDIKTFYLNQ